MTTKLNVKNLKLGKNPPKHDSRTIMFGDYLVAGDTVANVTWQDRFCDLFRRHRRHPIPTPVPTPTPVTGVPTSLLESNLVNPWYTLGNDKYGCCVESAGGHVVELVSMLGQHVEAVVQTQDVLNAYTAITGFNPNDPRTDNGTNILDFLNYWRQTGVAGHKISGFAALNPKSLSEWELANWLFGSVVVGLALPITAQSQVGKAWSVVSTSGDGAPGSWGGHCVPFVDYSGTGASCVTWGMVQQANWQFIATYCDEAYVVFDPDLLNSVTQKSPQGFDVNQLNADLSQFHA